MKTEEKIDAIWEVQEKLFEAIEMLKDITRGDRWAEAYILAPLEVIASSGHEYLDSSPNLDTWIKALQGLGHEDEDEKGS